MLKHFDPVYLPHNPEAERTILGRLLVDNGLFAIIADRVEEAHFFEPVHQRIFGVVRDAFLAGEVASPVTLKERFNSDKAISDIGGARYLVRLVAECSIIADIGAMATEVHRMWQRRQLIEWCGDAIRGAADSEAAKLPDEIAAGLSANLNDMAGTDRRKQVINDQQVTMRIVEKLQLGTECYSTGISKLDEAMRGGLYPGKMYGFAAFSKVGKTNLAATVSYNLAQAGVKHLFVCGEMGADEIHERVVARAMQAYPSQFNHAEPAFIARVEMAAGRFSGHTLYQNAPGLTIDDLKQYMSRAVYRDKAKGVILDYFQLVGGAKPRESEAKHLDGVAQWLADFGREHKIFTIVTAQRNDEGDIRGSRGLRLACDQLYYLNREDLSQPQAWLEMNATRYTKWLNIGSEDYAGLMLNEKGPYFEE